ncbi:MAG: hypothetical protein L0Y44_09500 [Phycisphaerales bacterium]|nr:hypothetical protein [Phycisphaerales bacterium]MCI0676184.1 hypothetical protein [Phycisphaerales bacterium]
MPDWLWLALQATFAIIAIEQLRRHALPVVNNLQHPSLILDVWGPLSLVIPMVLFVARLDSVQWTMRGIGWMIIGGPIVCGLIALGLSMIGARSLQARAQQGAPSEPSAAPGSPLAFVDPLPRRLILSIAGAGFLLLLLAAAHDLTLWMGQCIFAIAAVLLWVNTPELIAPGSRPLADQRPTRAELRAGIAMTIAVACSVGQAVASLATPNQLVPISGAIIIATAAMVLAYTVVLAGTPATLRLGLWSASLGVLFGLGAISIAHVVPEAWRIIRTGESMPLDRIATGFGNYALEAFVLLAMAGGAAAITRPGFRLNPGQSTGTPQANQSQVPVVLYRALGLTFVTLAALLAAWRLASINAA